MGLAEFETAMIVGESWTQQQADNLRALISELIVLRDIHITAKTVAAAAVSRWNAGLDADVTALAALFNIPNPTDLSGTDDIVRENLINNLMSYITTVNGLGTQAHLDNLLPLVGSMNIE